MMILLIVGFLMICLAIVDVFYYKKTMDTFGSQHKCACLVPGNGIYYRVKYYKHWRIVNMSNDIENKPYLEEPKENVETTKEQLIYGGGETLQEVQEKRKKQQLLNE